MPGHQYTPAEYAQKRVVESFGNLLFEIGKHCLTHTYAVVYHFSQIENIEDLVLRYLNTGALPFEEFSEEWLYDDEAESLSILETVCGTVLIWNNWRKQRKT
jgi:hypothetical protein